jgi:hypothetical protein
MQKMLGLTGVVKQLPTPKYYLNILLCYELIFITHIIMSGEGHCIISSFSLVDRSPLYSPRPNLGHMVVTSSA